MTAILAYCDPIGAAPGDTVRFMVSCVGARDYDAQIVRLINPQAGPQATRSCTKEASMARTHPLSALRAAP